MGLKKLLEESPEAYYWAGFIMADGSFSRNNHNLKVVLSIKDNDHLIKLSKFLGTTVHKTNNSQTENSLVQKYFQQITLRIAGKQHFSEIMRKFDYRPRKTYNPPKNISIKNDDLFISFLIGYIDGDGCIGEYKHSKNTLEIECNIAWAQVLTKWFKRLFKIAKIEKTNSVIRIPVAKIYHRDGNGFAHIRTCNVKCLMFLKKKIEDLKLPVMLRKWDRIKVRAVRSDVAYARKIKAIDLFNKNMQLKDISKIIGINRPAVAAIIHRSKKLWSKERLTDYKKHGKIRVNPGI